MNHTFNVENSAGEKNSSVTVGVECHIVVPFITCLQAVFSLDSMTCGAGE